MQPSFTSSLVKSAEKAGRFQEEEKDIVGTAGLAYGGEQAHTAFLRREANGIFSGI